MMETEPTAQRCVHCKRDIPTTNYVTHETHCKRNIELCKLCGEPVPKTQKEEHLEEFHAEIRCKCGKKMEKRLLDEHQANECRQRMMRCEYCDLELAFEQFNEHVEYCGSRTEKCEKCGQFVQKKGQSLHDATNCGSLLLEDEAKPKKTIVVDVEIAPQGREKGERTAATGERRRKQSKRSLLSNNRADLTPYVDPDSTMLPVNVEASRRPVMPPLGPAMTGRGPPADDSDYAWQVAQDINGLSVKPEKIKLHRPRFDVDEPGVRGLGSMNNGVRPSESLQAASLKRGLVVGESFVLPEGESMDQTLAEQLEWQRVHGGNQSVPGYEESLPGLSQSEMAEQVARDRLLAEQLEVESTTTMPLDSLGLSELDRRLQEDAIRRFERIQQEKQEEERSAVEEKRRKQLEEDEALARQLQEQMAKESPQLGFPVGGTGNRMNEWYGSEWEDRRRREEGSQEEEEEEEEARHRQIVNDEEMARNLQREWEYDRAGASDSYFPSSSHRQPRETRQSTNPPRRGFRYAGADGFDIGEGSQSSRRSTLVDDEVKSSMSSDDELGLSACKFCSKPLLPSMVEDHEFDCPMKRASMGSRHSQSGVSASSLASTEAAPRLPSQSEESSMCPYCYKRFLKSKLMSHQLQCSEKAGTLLSKRPGHDTLTSSHKSFGVVGVEATGRPCRDCRKNVKLADLHRHKIECDENRALTSQLRRDLLPDHKSTSTSRVQPLAVRGRSRDATDEGSISLGSGDGTSSTRLSLNHRHSTVSTKQDPSRLTNRLLQESEARTKLQSLDLMSSTRTRTRDRNWEPESKSPLSFTKRQMSLDSHQPDRLLDDDSPLGGTRPTRRRSNSFSSATVKQPSASTGNQPDPMHYIGRSGKVRDVTSHSPTDRYLAKSRPSSGSKPASQFAKLSDDGRPLDGTRPILRRSNSFTSSTVSRPSAISKHRSELEYPTGSSIKGTKGVPSQPSVARYLRPLSGRSATSKPSSDTKPHWK